MMKSTGVVRKVDELGRIVIPVELRRNLEIEEKDPMEIFIDGERIILQKYKNELTCEITGEITDKNRRFGNGSIVLSPRGAEKLIRELESYRQKMKTV